MHRTHHLQSLEKLSPPLRNIALAASKEDCSAADFARFLNLWKSSPPSQIALFLPVVLSILDSSRIPTISSLDDLSDTTTTTIARVVSCLPTAYALHPELEDSAVEDLWDRALLWLDFLFFHYDALAGDARTTLTSKWDIIFPFNSPTLRSPTYQESTRFHQTPRYASLLIHASQLGLQRFARHPSHRPPDDLLDIWMQLPGDRTAAQLAAFIDAVGGTLEDLATHIRKQIAFSIRFLPSPTTTDPGSKLLFSASVELASRLDEASAQNSDRPMPLALLRSGVVKDAFRALERLFSSSSGRSPLNEESLWGDAVGAAVDLIHLTLFAGPTAIRHALKRGLLRVVGNAADRASIPRRDPGTPARYRGCRAAPGDGSGDMAIARSLRRSKIFSAWEKLVHLAQEHTNLVVRFEQRTRIAACDNVPCSQIGPAEHLCCGGCRTTRYCSAECQRADWTTGKHKHACRAAAISHSGASSIFLSALPRKYAKQQLAFFSFALTEHYRKECARTHVFAALRTLVLRDSDPRAFGAHPRGAAFILFNFTAGVILTLGDVLPRSMNDAEAIKAVAADNPRLHELLDRVRRSNGRMALHVMRLPWAEGAGQCWMLIPLRMNMSFCTDLASRLVESNERNYAEDALGALLNRFEQVDKPDQLLFLHQ
ncbi:MYND-type domain-containing protein [Mycena kentingensis (nom. inval.)]|nr:MYND-type domain-containing protein [Mycena kentingensis (nom. inval.)]